jgi:hypothetical protein
MRSAADSSHNPKPLAEADERRDETFLRRWSRRKQEARAQSVPAPANEAVPAPPAPAIDSLTADSDFSVFMSPGVSETLRRLALRKLWSLPEFNERCPLDSEWYDCRNLEPLGNVVTHEMREALEREAQKLKDAAVSALRDETRVAPDEKAPPPGNAGEPTSASETARDENAERDA